MRISDWSSDVCSSDLLSIALGSTVGGILVDMSGYASTFAVSAAVLLGAAFLAFFAARADTTPAGSPNPPQRSEEHTSELQSLMRISYAVFCLKKKKHKTKTQDNT